MKNPVLKVNLLIRAETALARVRARRTANRIILSLVALVFVLIGVAMLNFAMYQAFTVRFSPGLASLFVALINLVLAGLVAPLLDGDPYLTSIWWTFDILGYAVSVGEPLFFDIGVYLGVAGTILLITFSLEEEAA